MLRHTSRRINKVISVVILSQPRSFLIAVTTHDAGFVLTIFSITLLIPSERRYREWHLGRTTLKPNHRTRQFRTVKVGVAPVEIGFAIIIQIDRRVNLSPKLIGEG